MKLWAGLLGRVTVLLCRFNETERLLKEVQAAHVSLTKQTDTLKKNHEALQLQQNKCATHTHVRHLFPLT